MKPAFRPPSSPATAPESSNLIGYRSHTCSLWRGNLLGYSRRAVALAAVTVFASVAHAGSCCKPEPKPEPQDACCAAAEIGQPAGPQPNRESKIENSGAQAAAFSPTSLYQADGVFTDDSGKTFRLAELRGRPVVVNMFFATCGYACPLAVTDLLAAQARLSPELRQQTVFVLVSFDLARDTTEALAQYRANRQLDANWILLRGDDASVRELAALLGVKYKQEADGSFAHSNLFTILNREGEIVHQRTGLSGGLDAAVAALETLR